MSKAFISFISCMFLLSRLRDLTPSQSVAWYVFGVFFKNLKSLVYCPKATIKTPLAKGSKVPE